MMNFLCPDTLIQSRARVRARASAVKMLALPCRAPVRSPYSVCTAYPTLFPSLEPSECRGDIGGCQVVQAFLCQEELEEPIW